MDQNRSYAGVGRGVRRRGTPIPVLPPRVPTPMPATVSRTTPSTLHTPSQKPGQQYLEDNVQAWINPQIYSKVDQDAVRSNNYVYETKMISAAPNSYYLYHQHNNNIPQHQAANNVEYVMTMTPQRSAALVSSRGREDAAASATSSPAPHNDVSGRDRGPRAPKMKHHHRPESSARNSVVLNGNRSTARSVSKSPVNCQQQISKSVCSKRHHHHHHGLGSRTSDNLPQTLCSGVPGIPPQSSAAAAFFARAAQKLNLSTSPRHRHHSEDVDGSSASSAGFAAAIHQSPPPVPPALLRRIGVKEVTGVGKVKVMLRVSSGSASGTSSTSNCNGTTTSTSSSSFFSIDARKKQVTLFDPAVCGGSSAPEDRRVGVAAPKMFAFDAIFSQDDSQTEICSSALTDVIHAVINGTDGCLFCFGHARLGKTYTMVGSPESAHTLGVIPCAISWLFRGINEQKQKTGARFSVRVSAVEVSGSSHHLRDLLAAHATDSDQSPGVYLRDDPLFGTQLQNQSELRVPTAEKAAFYLDAALNCRERGGRDSHFLYTLHVYQYSVADRGGVAGGRSRLHLIDLASCERARYSGGLPLSGLGNVLLAIFNGQKHLPYREHRITHLLKECLSSLTCHAAMIVHVSPYAQHYTDTLATVQLASRIHRMRRRKIKFVGGSSGCGRSSSEDVAHLQAQENGQSTGSSDVDPSSSEQSADTVIYVGPSDDPTDGEHPPVYIPSLNGLHGPSTSPQHLPNGNCSHHSGTLPDIPRKPLVLYRTITTAVNRPQCERANILITDPMSVSLANQQSLPQSNKILTSDTISGSDEQWIDGTKNIQVQDSRGKTSAQRWQQEERDLDRRTTASGETARGRTFQWKLRFYGQS